MAFSNERNSIMCFSNKHKNTANSVGVKTKKNKTTELVKVFFLKFSNEL